MLKFTEHFRMTEKDAIDYVLEKTLFFNSDARLSCSEIGDGNINYVFRIKDEISGKSLILKQADKITRSGKNDLSMDRSRIEAEILQLQGNLAKGFVPEVYLYDPVMYCLIMEDLYDYQSLRLALIEHKTFPTLAEDISTFLADTLIRSTDSVLSPKEKKKFVKQYINPELCDISERLVFTDPYKNTRGRNKLFLENEEFLTSELYEDEGIMLEVAKLKESFKCKAQSLIHGDLHTGSIFVKPGHSKVLDPEFAFYGPAGYDIGNVIANLIFAWVNAEFTMGEGEKRSGFQKWLEETIAGIVDKFKEKAIRILNDHAQDPMAKVKGFSEWLVSDIICDTAGITGAELNRRIIGSAKVKDITLIEETGKRVMAEQICVLCGKYYIMERNSIRNGQDYIKILHSIKNDVYENNKIKA